MRLYSLYVDHNRKELHSCSTYQCDDINKSYLSKVKDDMFATAEVYQQGANNFYIVSGSRNTLDIIYSEWKKNTDVTRKFKFIQR